MANATLDQLQQKAVAPREAALPSVAPGFGSLQSFELMLRQSKLLMATTLVPTTYRAITEKKGRGGVIEYIENPNALANCAVALNMAQRMGADPLMVMQNLYIVEGRPSWSSQWIIAAINGCGRFSPLRFDLEDLGNQEVEYTTTEWVDGQRTNKKHKQTIKNLKCIAWALEKETGEKITSPVITVEMAVKEGWYQKNGSKWQTMPEVMLRYRSASFFGKIYAPELLMGLQSSDEAQDMAGVIDARQDSGGSFSVDVDSLKQAAASAGDTVDAVVETMATAPAAAEPASSTVDPETGEILPNGGEVAAPIDEAAKPEPKPRRQREAMNIE